MRRMVKNSIRGAALAHTPAVHNNDLVTHGRNDAQVMCNHDDRHTHLLLQVLHQLQDLRLNGNVQRGRRLIRNQDIRLTAERHGNHDTLAHASRKLIGILLHTALRLIYTDERQHLDRPLPGLILILVRVKKNCLLQLIADREDRIQRSHRVLEDNRYLLATVLRKLLLIPLRDILALIADLSTHDPSGLREDLHDRICRNRFSGARFSHDSKGLALLQVECHSVDRFYFTGICEEAGMEVIHLQ